MRRSLASVALLAAGALHAAPSSAVDCTSTLSDTDKVVCSSAELQAADVNMSGLVGQLANFLDDKEAAESADEQRRWRDDWVRSCAPEKSPAERVYCLGTKALTRLAELDARLKSVAAYRGRDEAIDVGGVPIVLKMTASPCQLPTLFIDGTPIMDCVYRIEPRARYRDADVDALAFVANGGGATYVCENFPMYVIAVRAGLPPDVVRVPSKQGKRHDAACLAVTRTSQGFRFGAAAEPGQDGWSQNWTPKGGLSPAVID